MERGDEEARRDREPAAGIWEMSMIGAPNFGEKLAPGLGVVGDANGA